MNWALKKMLKLTEEQFNHIKYDLEVLISFCSDSKKTTIKSSDLIDLLLDVYSKFLKIKEE